MAMEEHSVVLKDNICDEAADMRCCSAILEGYRATSTAHAVSSLRALGSGPYAVLSELRANMDEFAMGSLTQNSIHGVIAI
jgi:Asp-tRNA(Asn)/Glu-tRNA(Gln) amidotransferase A subunit family amidase